jgi:hypothetical protein
VVALAPRQTLISPGPIHGQHANRRQATNT